MSVHGQCTAEWVWAIPFRAVEHRVTGNNNLLLADGAGPKLVRSRKDSHDDNIPVVQKAYSHRVLVFVGCSLFVVNDFGSGLASVGLSPL
jgi:hypothetical protein